MRFLFAVGLMTASLTAVTFPEPPKPMSASPAQGKATAVLAGGCFWGMQGIFEHVKGVTGTEVGYAGGSKSTASYMRIERGDTNHAESIKVTYDPAKISYGQLLKIYFSVAHDPTTLNRQHNDVGTQYRSAIFYANDEQRETAEAYIKTLNDSNYYGRKVVTQVVPLQGFYRAEEYHQHYLDQVVACDANFRPECGELNSGYIRALDIPLQNNFKKTFPELYMKESK
ncbi:MAG: peptide-methionine (S)-S-oxide reductase MsrA [Acidobacteriota bacterium]|nr:peptide-methionine (S)-S-oxide reductase MsrA [Acidobacteriota bacterium]